MVYITLAMGLFFAEKDAYIISKSIQIGYLLVTFIGSKSGAIRVHAVKIILADYASMGFNVNLILVDSEKGMMTIGQFLDVFNVNVNKAGPDQHVLQIERAIRVVEERVRC